MSRTLAGYIIVAGLAASRVEGQELEQMARRIDSLQRQAIAAQAAVIAYRKSAPVNLGYRDSSIIAGGKVKVFFNPELAELARAASAEADAQLAHLGSAMNRVGSFVFSIATDSALNYYDTRYGRTQELSVRYHSKADPRRPNRTSTDDDPKSVAAVIVGTVSNAAGMNSASVINRWASGGLPLAPGSNHKPDWGALRLEIVSSASHFGRDCFAGEIRACRLFLELDTVADPASMVFDAAGRKRMVMNESDNARRASRVATERCLGGNDDACLTVLRMIHISALSSPFVRASVVSHALTMGGPQAAERLVITPGSTRDAIAAAAGQPIDSVIADWQRHLNERSGTASNLPLSIAISSLVWIALCVFLSLRSSRWR
jgi:hypothetical protein